MPSLLEQYIANIRTIHHGESGYHECIDILQIFRPSTRQFISNQYYYMTKQAQERQFILVKTWNEFVLQVDRTSRQMQVRLSSR